MDSVETTPPASPQPPEKGLNITPQLAGETAKAYGTFLAYRDMGPTRSISKTVSLLGGRSARQCQRSFESWSLKHHWVDRSRAWDGHNEAIRQVERNRALAAYARKWERRRLETIEETWQVAERLQAKALEMLKHGLRTKQITAEGATKILVASKWSMKDAATFLKTCTELKTAAIQAVGELRPIESMTKGEEDATLDAILPEPEPGPPAREIAPDDFYPSFDDD